MEFFFFVLVLGGGVIAFSRIKVSKPDYRSEAVRLANAAQAGEDISIRGRAFVIDGDSLVVRGVQLRLAGIDAPELHHPYGENAKSAMIRLCRGQEITAVIVGSITYDRAVAACYLPDGRDLAAELVKLGLAIDWPKFSGGKYRHLEPDGVRQRLWRVQERQYGRARM
jgi:endonuclease YncB( thermonuclease family)